MRKEYSIVKGDGGEGEDGGVGSTEERGERSLYICATPFTSLFSLERVWYLDWA